MREPNRCPVNVGPNNGFQQQGGPLILIRTHMLLPWKPNSLDKFLHNSREMGPVFLPPDRKNTLDTIRALELLELMSFLLLLWMASSATASQQHRQRQSRASPGDGSILKRSLVLTRQPNACLYIPDKTRSRTACLYSACTHGCVRP
jgi:hypothetical protein